MPDDDDWGFAPPPFNAEQSLLQLQRAMRDCKLTARGKGFELRGKAVVELEVQRRRDRRAAGAPPGRTRPSGIASP